MHMVDCMSVGWLQPDWPCPNELWLRWGLDGVTVWRQSYVTLTVALGGIHEHLPFHAVGRFGTVAVLNATEKMEPVEAMLGRCGLDQALSALEGSYITVKGRPLRVRKFVLGDHMALQKVTGADYHSCTKGDKQTCPYCTAPPASVLSWSALPSPFKDFLTGVPTRGGQKIPVPIGDCGTGHCNPEESPSGPVSS